MDKITYTPAGLAFMQQHMSHQSSLPALPNCSHPEPSENRSMLRHSGTKGKLDVGSLRSILRDDTIAEVNKLKEQTKAMAYLHVKQELMRDITGGREFLNSKAKDMARRMLADEKNSQFLQTEIGKGRNYLGKLIGEHEARMDEDERLRARLKERVKAVL